MVAVCGAASSFFQATTSPTLAWTGCGLNLKSLIVTLTVAAAPAGAEAHAAALAGLPAAVLAAGADPAGADAATDGCAAVLAAGVGVAPPPQAASAARASVGRSGTARRRMAEFLHWLIGRGEADP